MTRRGPQESTREGAGGHGSCTRVLPSCTGRTPAQRAEGSGPGLGSRCRGVRWRGTHHGIEGQQGESAANASHLEPREMMEQRAWGSREESERETGSRREGRGAGPLTLSEGIHLEARHFLGQDRLGQVEEGRVVDGEVMVILLQDPHGHTLDAVGERAGGGGRRDRQGCGGEGDIRVGWQGGKGHRTGAGCFQEAWLRAQALLTRLPGLPQGWGP